VSRVSEILSVSNVDVNAKDNFGWTPIHEAVSHGSVDIVKLLLDFQPKNLSAFLRKTNPGLVVDLFALAGTISDSQVPK
jgi:ankyrin repeat protein